MHPSRPLMVFFALCAATYACMGGALAISTVHTQVAAVSATATIAPTHVIPVSADTSVDADAGTTIINTAAGAAKITSPSAMYGAEVGASATYATSTEVGTIDPHQVNTIETATPPVPPSVTATTTRPTSTRATAASTNTATPRRPVVAPGASSSGPAIVPVAVPTPAPRPQPITSNTESTTSARYPTSVAQAADVQGQLVVFDSHARQERIEAALRTAAQKARGKKATSTDIILPILETDVPLPHPGAVLKSSLEEIAQLLKAETGVAIDLSPSSRPIAGSSAAATPAPEPTEAGVPAAAGEPAVLAQRSDLSVYADTDSDGLSDYDETNIYHTDPRNAYTAESILTDGERAALGLDMLSTSSARVAVETPSAPGIPVSPMFEVSSIAYASTSATAVEVGTATSTAIPTEALPPIHFAGKAYPNSLVTLFIFSTPIVVTVKTDDAGAWNYTLDAQLEDGTHTLYVASVDNSGKILAESPAIPFTKRAEAIDYAPLAIAAAAGPDPMDILRDNLFAVAGAAVVIFALIVLLVLGLAHRTSHPDLPPEDAPVA
jgi:hypothetical protein